MDAITQIVRDDPWLVIPVAAICIPIVAIIVSGVHGIVRTVVRHRERMALIQQGVSPDRLPPMDESAAKRVDPVLR